MADNIVRLPLDYFSDPDTGKPVSNGSVFVGNVDTDPEIEANRKTVTIRQEDGTEVPILPAGQPLVTGAGGRISFEGSSARILTDGNYSIKVLNSSGSQVYFFENALDGVPLTSDEVFLPIDIVADMIADASLNVGDTVKTKGYISIGDGGDNEYDIVAAGTGTADGGSFIDLATHQAQGLFPRSVFNVQQWGASEAGSVAVNTTAIQAAWNFKPRILHYLRGDFIVNKLVLPAATMTHIGSIDPRAAARSRLTFNPSGTATDPMVELEAISSGNGNTFVNFELDTNDRAQYGYYLASGSVFQAIKNMRFINCEVNNLKSGAVGWQIGDQTNTGFDTDAFNYNWEKCAARGSAGSIGWVIDAANAFNLAWYDCFNSRKDGSNFMLSAIKTIRGSGFRLYNFFGDELQSAGDPWVIDHNSGSMSIFGMNTEDHRVIKARTIGRSEDSLNVDGVQVNDSTGDNGVVMDTTMITSVKNCTFDTSLGGDNRVIVATNRFYAENVSLGSAGEYKLTGEPRQNVIEGLRVGVLPVLGFNPTFNFWVETGADKAPSNWRLNKGTGTATIQQSTTNANIGEFSTHVDCSVANTGDVMGINLFRAINIAAFRGSTINIAAVATRVGTETMEIECLVDGVDILLGGTTVFQEFASGGRILAWGSLDIPSNGVEIDALSLKAGLPSGQTGELYIDAIVVIPISWSGRIPALWEHIQYLLLDHESDFFKVNQTTNRVLVDSGAVLLTSNSTSIVTTEAAALTLVDGANNQEISLVMTIDGGAATLTPDNLANGTNIVFDDVGDSAQIKFISGSWHFMGGTATLS